MKDEVFYLGIKRLELALRGGKEISDKLFKLYWEKLKDKFSDHEFEAKVENIIDTKEYFPVISAFLNNAGRDGYLPSSNNPFDQEIIKISRLTNRTWESKEQRDLTYSRLKRYSLDDFKSVCSDDNLLVEVQRFGLSYAVLQKHIEKQQSRRLEKERAKENAKLKNQARSAGAPIEIKKYIEKVKNL